MVFEELTRFALKQKLIGPEQLETMLAKPITIAACNIRETLLKKHLVEQQVPFHLQQVEISEA